MSDESRQSRRQIAIFHLARGVSLTGVAKLAGCSTKTVSRWAKNPDFKHRVVEVRAGLVDRACGGLSDASVEAVATLRKLLKSKSETVRLSASRCVLDYAITFKEAAEFDGRLRTVETKLQELAQ